METRARLDDMVVTPDSLLLIFAVPLSSGEAADRLRGKDVRLKAVTWREKRSLSANAYFYVLVDKLAKTLSLSQTEVHNQLISDYGFADEDIKTIIMRDSIDWRKIDSIHLRPTPDLGMMGDGEMYRKYIVMRGSHTYDSKEMSVLIDGTVQECKEQGIETLPPQELQRMYEEMEVRHG